MALARLSLHVNVLKDINTFEISVYQLNCSLVRYYGLYIINNITTSRFFLLHQKK